MKTLTQRVLEVSPSVLVLGGLFLTGYGTSQIAFKPRYNYEECQPAMYKVCKGQVESRTNALRFADGVLNIALGAAIGLGAAYSAKKE